MGKINKYRKGISGFISSEKGQRFFNFAYSIGAAIVIWGALFKILHLPGGNTLLSIGMGTEVLMFILTAFDRPPKEYKWEDVFPVLDSKNPEDRPDFSHGGEGGVSGGGVIIGGGGIVGGGSYPEGEIPEGAQAASGVPSRVVFAGGGYPTGGVIISGGATGAEATGEAPLPQPANAAEATEQYKDQITLLAEEMQHLRTTTEALNTVSDTLLASYRAITENSENISASSTGYVEQMESLNRNIAGLNTIYEIQLKSISSQLDSIDRVNRGIKDIRDMYEKSAAQSARYCEETEKMARYMQQLNSVYEKMITAMTINMYRPMMGATPDMPVPPQTEEGKAPAADASDEV